MASGNHTHLFSDVAEDTHVSLVLTRQLRVPEIVVTQTYIYTIDVNGKIAATDPPLPG